MKNQSYALENVNYSFNRKTRKWHFVVGTVTFITNCPGGKETADAVAKQVLASVRRSKSDKIDGLARKAIDKLVTVTQSID